MGVPVMDFQFVRRNDLAAFPHMPDDFVHQQDHRGTEPFGQVEGADSLVEGVLDGARAYGNDGMISVGTPFGLHHVALRGGCGKAGGGTGSHDVNDDDRDFRDGGVADVLLLQGKSRTGGRRHRFCACHRRAQRRRYAGNLVLHLHKFTADLRQTYCAALRDFRGRGYGVAREKPHSGGQSTLDAGLVSLQELESFLFLRHLYASSTQIA